VWFVNEEKESGVSKAKKKRKRREKRVTHQKGSFVFFAEILAIN
jgi:hypothetical protein